MRVRHTFGILLIFTLLALLGCSTKNVSNSIPPDRQASDFSLNVMDDSYYGGATVQDFTLSTTDYGEDVVVSIHAEGASDLKALFFDLSYDADHYRPLSARPSDSLENTDDMLRLSVFKDRGTVHYGQILGNPDWRTGLTGNGEVATVMFRKEATPALRSLSTVSTAAASAAPLTLTGTDLSWYYAWQGDYDQNGETNGADLVPLALNLFDSGPFAIDSADIITDGDGNGEINNADIVPIAVNFGHSALGGYNVYHSLIAGDYPDGGTLLMNVAFNSATGGYPADRRAYTADGSGAPVDSYYWVQATDGSSDGTASNLAGNEGNLPVLSLTNPPAGGDGTLGNPFVADVVTDYVFSLVDPVDGDVSTDPATSYAVSNAAAGSIAGGSSTLNIEDAFTGTFSVTANYDGKPNRSDTTVYLTIGAATANVEIYPDPADADWGGVTGAGTSGDPFIVSVSGGFNDDLSLEFSMLADDDPGTAGPSGNDIPVGDLTWAIDPPFLVTWISPGTFAATFFTSNYIFAQDGDMNESNHVYVVTQSLPE